MAKLQTSVIVEGLAGSAGSVTFVNSRTGLIMRPRVVPVDPETGAQIAIRANLAAAARAYKALDPQIAEMWRAYGESLPNRLTGIAAYTALTSKFLQIQSYLAAASSYSQTPNPPILQSRIPAIQQSNNPAIQQSSNPPISQSSPPLFPPGESFAGDTLRLTTTTEAPNRIWFNPVDWASNRPGVLTELLIQPLAGPNRKPERAKYRTRAFVAVDGESVSLTVSPGAYAPAYRFVDPATGQESTLFTLPVLVL